MDSAFIETVKIGDKDYEYFMTNDTEALQRKLDSLGCRLPTTTDYRYNPALSQDVRARMEERDTKWSLTTSNGVGCLNFYTKKGTPFIVWLSELIDPERLGAHANFPRNLSKQLESIGAPGTVLPGGWQPLMFAVLLRRAEIVRLLLEAGADANSHDRNGTTALMLAVLEKDITSARLLIRHGADVNAIAANGYSALLHAIFQNSQDMVALLQENGADLHIPLTPTLCKEKRSFSETLEFYIATTTLNGRIDISLIYKRCGMSKQTFSKIRSNHDPDFHPRKNNVLLLAIGMNLTLAQTANLLDSAGYLLDEKSEADRIVRDHIARLDYNIHDINAELWEKTRAALLPGSRRHSK